MVKIALEIKNCSECPFLVANKVYTADSFEDVQRWDCSKAEKLISSAVEDNYPGVPEWCPIKFE